MGIQRTRSRSQFTHRRMQKITLTTILCVAALMPLGVSAKETIGGYPLEYDQTLSADTDGNGTPDRTSYYLGNRLVWSAYDEDEDGAADLWLRYRNGDMVDLELTDQNGDGKPEKIAEFDTAEKREVIFDSEAAPASGGSSPLLGALVILGLAAVLWQNRDRAKELLGGFAKKRGADAE